MYGKLVVGAELRERGRAGEVAVVEDAAGRVAVRLDVLGHVRPPRALRVADHVGRVVGDDVEVDLHPPAVGGVDERAQVLVRAEVRVDLGEVGDPVAVVAGALVLGLDGLVLEARREPDRVRAEPADVVDPVQQALQVAAVVVAACRRVEAGDRLLRRQAAVVVRRVAVLEAVGHDEVEGLVGHRRAQRVPRVLAVLARGGGREGRAGSHPGDDGDDGGGASARHGLAPLLQDRTPGSYPLKTLPERPNTDARGAHEAPDENPRSRDDGLEPLGTTAAHACAARRQRRSAAPRRTWRASSASRSSSSAWWKSTPAAITRPTNSSTKRASSCVPATRRSSAIASSKLIGVR